MESVREIPATLVPTPQPVQRLLVVEDFDDARVSLQQMLHLSLHLEVDSAENGELALEMLRKRPYSLVITDLKMPKVGGLALIDAILQEQIPVSIIVTTGHGSIKDAVQAIRRGAYDFLTKPADPQHLCLLVRRALRERALTDEVAELRRALSEKHGFHNVLSRSPKMNEIFDLINNVSDAKATVLIRGETGTGKEQVARAVHQASALYRQGAFVAVNCGALNENLLESELFGHERGSFTGADRKRIGRFEMAEKGTLFLDEIGDVPMSMQIRLLRVLQERRFERVGGIESVEVDVRIVAATHQNLEKLVKEGKFREDLYYRLNVVSIHLPPLRERPEDIPLLVNQFIEKYVRPGQKVPAISPAALSTLVAYHWPGNIRQLENTIERACLTARDGEIQLKDLPTDVIGTTKPRQVFQVDLDRPLPEQLSELVTTFEKKYLSRALKRTKGHVGKCAEIAGLSRRSITEKISQYAIDKRRFKSVD